MQVQVCAELVQVGSDLLVLYKNRSGLHRLLLGEDRKDVHLLILAMVNELVLERPPGDTEGYRIVTGRLKHD